MLKFKMRADSKLGVFNPSGKETLTYGEALEPIQFVNNKEQAQKFIEDYFNFTKKVVIGTPEEGMSDEHYMGVVKSNIGYYAGYFDNDTRNKVHDLFEIEHPYLPRNVAPDEALRIGMTLAKNGI